MYVISLVTEHDVAAGGCYKVIHKDIYDLVDIIDDVGEEYTLSSVEYVEAGKESYAEHQNKLRSVRLLSPSLNEVGILRERIEALQEENAELKFRLDGLEK